MRRLLLLTVCISAFNASAAVCEVTEPAQVSAPTPGAQKSTPGRKASTPARKGSAAFATRLRARLAESVPVKAVRLTPGSGVLRVTTEDSVLRQPTYESVLAIACEEITTAKQLNTVAAIEVLNGTERQGYVYRMIWKCSDIAEAPAEKLRLMLLPGTRVFRPRP
jgi:hypothetical protein